jgi:hypothetical protein
MRIELLHVDGCPSLPLARERVDAALAQLGLDGTPVHLVRVPDAAEAERLGFLGSPSIRVDGVDLLTSNHDAVGLTCRRYATPDGLRGCPTQDQVVDALWPFARRR